jgi:uncharacterized membrane protein SpoIIM required for sporulation
MGIGSHGAAERLMERERWIENRRERWTRLETLLARASRGRLDRFSGEELLELGDLYRAVTADLATARRDLPGDRATFYLERLAARAHTAVYREEPVDANRIGSFFRYGFPQTYREGFRYIGLAIAILTISAIIAAILVTLNGSYADTLLGSDEASSLRAIMSQHHLWFKSATENHSVTQSFITLNNVRVAFFAFAGGVLVGLGAIYVLVLNGINLGAVAALVATYGLSRGFWSFVVPHGVVELSVICMAGGAGMMIGDAILRPGLLPRSLAVTGAARRAGILVIGGALLLVFAGATESWFSPSDAPNWLKWAYGAASGVALYSYLFTSRPQSGKEQYRFEDVPLLGAMAAREQGMTSGPRRPLRSSVPE